MYKNGYTVERILIKFIKRYELKRRAGNLMGSLIIFSVLFALQVLINQFFILNIRQRTLIFYTSVGMAAVHFLWFVCLPLIQWLIKTKKQKIHSAGKIIRGYFPEIEDKLLNIIELTEEGADAGPEVLVRASIEQKTREIQPERFYQAIHVKALLYIIIAGIGIMAVIAGSGFVLKEPQAKGYRRTLHYNTPLQELESFNFKLHNKKLVTLKGEDFKVEVTPDFPMRKDECFIEIGGQSFKMKKEENRFSYTIKAPNNETPFNFKRGKIISKTFVLKVVPKTELTNITIRIKPPKYTGLKVKRIVNEGNIEIVEGTELRWKIKYDHATKNMLIFSNDSMINEGSQGDYEKRMYKSGMYQILAIGQLPYDTLKVNYSVNVLPDLYPEIVVSGIMDSTYEQTVYFKGWIRDDYGLSRLTVIIKGENGITLKQKEIEIEPDSRQQYFYWIDKINTYTGNVTVGFIVYDNDEIHGPKKTESKLFYYHIKNRNEIDKENMRRVEEIAKKVTDGNSKIQQIREKIEALRRNEITNELSNWEISERRKELMQIERDLKEALNEIALKNEIKNKTEEKWLSEELRNKADEIQKLFKNLMDDELKNLLQQYEELLKEQDKSRENELLREMDMSLENLKEKMDMSLELLKRYDVEKELMNRADEMDQLRKQVEKENTDKNTQPEIKKNLEEWNKKLDENIFKNNQLKEPYNLKNVEKQVNKLRKDIEKKRGENSNKEITKSMKEISNKLRQTVGMNGGGEFLDIEELRKQVHALVIVSLEHETIMDAMNQINIKSPLYNQNMIREHEIEQKFNRIRDSLISYGYKQPIITKIIGKEMFHVETAFERLWRNYNEQIISRVRISQNEIMKGLNEVAVRLDEIVRSLEKAKGQASGSKGFTDSRRKKKGGDQLKNMTQQQQSLKEQLKSMIEQMKNNGNKKNGMNEQLAKMLAEREKMRRKIEQLYREGNYGKNVKEKLNQALKMMDEVEKDIIYKRLSKATVEKDEWINTRLLEAENAEKQQESENRRESKEFKGEFERSIIDSLTKNKVQKERIQELKYKSVRLKAYYQERYDKYLESLKKKK